ncbi:MAG: metallophosphoesterase [Clostridia bacterium]|nr:metallophosphoesterase [Clostridia bacterium]
MKRKFKLSKKAKIFVAFLSCVAIVFLGYNIIQNQHFEVNKITIKCETLPEDFQGYKIVQVSDLHNTEFGENNSALLSAIKEQSPDIIVVTGDIVDSRRTNVQIARDFVNDASKVAPVYYVTGNHEARVKVEDEIDNVELNENVIVLHNKDVLIEKGESVIQLIGVDDPDYKAVKDSTEYMNKRLNKYCNNEYFKILLSHRPELFEVYVENEMNVIFSGHAHGGQFRLPFIGGVIAPHQGLFPTYDAGLFYATNDATMVISRGLGNSIIPLRINNPPELVVVTLEKK